MKTSEFLSTLRTHANLPLTFQAGGHAIAPDYHLTEIKDVAYRTMDCGAALHRWVETQFELWVPPSREEGRSFMPADKFLRIVNRVQRELPLDGESEARIFVSLGGHPASLHAIDSVAPSGGKLVVTLGTDRARCKAREREAATGQGCGCGTKTEASAGAVCCA